jgi:hypothetical protein
MKFRLLPRWAQLRKLGRLKFSLLFSSTATLPQFIGDLGFGSVISPEKYLLRFLCWSLFAFYMWRRAESSFERYGEKEKF